LLVDLAHIEGDSYAPEEPVVVASVASTFSTSLSFNFGVSELLFSLNFPNNGAEYAPEEPEPVASLASFLPILLYFFLSTNGSLCTALGVPKLRTSPSSSLYSAPFLNPI
jgi:hypothetical protein